MSDDVEPQSDVPAAEPAGRDDAEVTSAGESVPIPTGPLSGTSQPRPAPAPEFAFTDGASTEPHEEPTVALASGRTKKVVLLALAAALVIAAIATFAVRELAGPSSSDHYISALKKQGLMSAFPAPRAAILTGRKFCTSIDNGGKDQGNAAQRVAVQYFCHTYLANFHVLRNQTVVGTFTISDGSYDPTNEFAQPNYESDGTDSGCEGQGGFSDLNSSTQVVVTDPAGTELARTELGEGTIDATSDDCEFTFQFDVMEGADQYVVAVGHRGSTDYTFDQLTQPDAVQLVIGNS